MSNFNMNLKTYLLDPFTDINQKRSNHGDSLHTLDGLRGIAVIIVLMSHTAAFGMYGQGSLGVLLFFFLSGFVHINECIHPVKSTQWIDMHIISTHHLRGESINMFSTVSYKVMHTCFANESGCLF